LCRHRPHPGSARFGCCRIADAFGLVERLACPKPVCCALAKEANDKSRQTQGCHHFFTSILTLALVIGEAIVHPIFHVH
jgi:hypothetical protein